jgi:hypothetical protein
MAPYITAWSEEVDPPVTVVELPGRGIAYADESVTDRDSQGVLWFRTVHRPGAGRPEFGRVHPARQRRAMLRLLCGVCGGPASRTDKGVLWVVRDFREDWPGWPDGMGMDEPPVCVPCLALSVRACPALRRGAAAFRVRQFPIAGVRGGLYTAGPRLVGDTTVAYADPAIRWVRAAGLVRQVRECTLVDLDGLRTTH